MDFKPFKIGKYLLLERLAMGGMAEVYRAKASGAGGFEKQLAIKRILPHYSQNPEFRRMFEYEARLSSMLTHANIVQIYDFVKSGETYLLALEYVDGKNLRQFINKIKKIGFNLPIELSVFIVNEVCKGLDYAHKKRDDLTGRSLNIIHRDMSPQNVMLSYEGAVKIVDFGIAKAKDRVDETRSGVIKGKFGYMSPEQANGEPVDHRTDIFSTAIILYELLTGRRLFAADNDMATLKLIQECIITPPSRINPKVTVELEKIAMKGLAKDQPLRYQSAGNFHRNLQEYLNKFYPSLSPKDLGDTLHRVFKEEIEQEKRRFEQIYRQSIPFSQGASTDEEEVNEEQEMPPAAKDEEDVTVSELEEKTGVTFVEEEGESPEPASLEDIAEFDVTNNSASIPTEEGTPEQSKSETGTQKTPHHVVDDVSQFSGLSENVSWSPALEKEKTAISDFSEAELDPETNEKTVIEDSNGFSMDSTPTEEKTPISDTELTPSPVSKPELSARTPATNSIRLEPAKHENRRGEPSLSHIKVMGNSDSPYSSRTEIGLEQKLEIQAPSESIYRRREQAEDPSARRARIFSAFRSLSTIVLFLSFVAGTAFLYKLYLNGSFPKLVASILKIPPVTPTELPETSAVPTAEPTHAPVQERAPSGNCSLNVDSDPRGANVTIGVEDRGMTPTIAIVECNRAYDVTITKEGYDTVSENIVTAQSERKLYKTLKQVPTGTLEVSVTQGATIEIREIGFSQYLQVNQSAKIPLRANRKYKLVVTNPVVGIEIVEDVMVAEGARLKKHIRVTRPTHKPKTGSPAKRR